MLELTQLSGSKILVNPQQITTVHTNPDDQSVIYFGRESYIIVKETLEQIHLMTVIQSA